MGFNTNTNAAQSTNTANRDDSWKADGFINFYLPGANGKPSKLGAIALKKGKGSDELMAWLAADQANAAKLLSSMTIVYQSATPENTSKFVLPS